jgi:predicted AlkP superfamily phosphohydrolase/phosphomutase
MLRLGKFQFPLGKATIRLLRKSKPFWSHLSDYRIFNAILRVPITFPPEKVRGVQLSAMCAPDLRGTQGMFSHYTTRPQQDKERTGGEVHAVTWAGKKIQGVLIGPQDPLRKETRDLKVPFTVTVQDPGRAVLKINGEKHPLRLGMYSDWIRVRFGIAPAMGVYGVCKFLLLGAEPEFDLYVTPVNIDPEKPAMPVSYPSVYSIYLAKRQGSFATLGLAEDTWALNEKVIGDQDFARQCIDIDNEREVMFFDALDKVPRGLCVCVFDGTDRMQHMFWRYIDEQHPARPAQDPGNHRTEIERLYLRMDDLVGRTMAKCRGEDNLLFVISDHGFNSFRRGLDLNRWLEENGYLKFKEEGRRGEQYLAGVDWSQTRAFSIGLAGLFLNLKGKYSQGIVEPGEEADKLAAEIAERLGAVKDPQTGVGAIKRVYQATKVYRGPYKENAPDLLVGYQRGYRVSWETAIGRTTHAVFHDNLKAWSGDHSIDPSLVPGVLFCNHPIDADNARILDFGPTILNLFGVPVPEYMDGKVLPVGGAAPKRETTAPASPPEKKALPV